MSDPNAFTDEMRDMELDGLPRLYLDGLRWYNGKDFFLCHELLEEVWRHSVGEHAEFYQGLIQASVCYYHWCNANFDGAMRLAKEALRRLSPLPREFERLQLGEFMDVFVPQIQPLIAGAPGLKPITPDDAPKWNLTPLDSEAQKFIHLDPYDPDAPPMIEID